MQQRDRLGARRQRGVVPDERVDPVRLDGLVTADAAAGEGVEAYVGHDADVVGGPAAHPVDVERPRGVLVRRRGDAGSVAASRRARPPSA